MKKLATSFLTCLLLVFSAITLTACGEEPWHGKYYYGDGKYITVTSDCAITTTGIEGDYKVENDILVTNIFAINPRFYNDYNVLSFGLSANFYYGTIDVMDGYTHAQVLFSSSEILTLERNGSYRFIDSNDGYNHKAGTYMIKDGIVKLEGSYLVSGAPANTEYHRIINNGYGFDYCIYLKDPDKFFATTSNTTENGTQPPESGTTSHTHSYQSVTTAPTCTSHGYTTYTCTCGESYTSDFKDRLEHNYSTKITHPTCTSYGYTTYTCTCGESYTSDFKDRLEHRWGQSITVLEPNGNDVGIAYKECQDCHARLNEILCSETSHVYGEWEITVAPTCIGEGERTKTCRNCPKTITETIEATGSHTYNADALCSVCGASQEESGLSLAKNATGYTVTGIGTCMDEHVVIPATYNGLPVNRIEDSAFQDVAGVYTIYLPNSVTSIGDDAFSGCSNLKTVFYQGDESKWNKISIDEDEYGNNYLIEATRYYYSVDEPVLNSEGTAYDGNYWHYDTDGVTPVIWKKEN